MTQKSEIGKRQSSLSLEGSPYQREVIGLFSVRMKVSHGVACDCRATEGQIPASQHVWCALCLSRGKLGMRASPLCPPERHQRALAASFPCVGDEKVDRYVHGARIEQLC